MSDTTIPSTDEINLASVLQKGAKTIKFIDLDRTVRILMGKILKNQVNKTLGDSEAFDFFDMKDLRKYMASLMFKGYLIGRKYLGKENYQLLYSGEDEDKIMSNFRKLEAEYEAVNIGELFKKAGRPVAKFLSEYSAFEAEKGLASKVEEEMDALMGVYRSVLSGFIIAVCEDKIFA
ncbi:hypothetical protein ISS30_03635 [bacterium]|nr:hypothetical protein [bacterium]